MKYQKLFSVKNKKTISICRLLKIFARVLSVNTLFPFHGRPSGPSKLCLQITATRTVTSYRLCETNTCADYLCSHVQIYAVFG